MLRVLLLLALALAPSAAAETPQESWMVHVDGAGHALRFVPDRILVVPGGTVQLMVFGNDHGRYSLVLEEPPGFEAEVDTAAPGIVHIAEFAAPRTPGTYAFHDRHHPSARGILTVAAPSASIGVGNGYDVRFYPGRLEVPAGSTFTFVNNATEIRHTLTSDDGSFVADRVLPGETRTLTAPAAPGEYPFACVYHAESGMRGVLVVTAAAATAQAASPPVSDPDRAVPGTGLLVLVALVGAVAAMRARRAR